ncbi:hypothetical protein RB195_006595 [Necator americanus]|uniref:Uncharacterized protein n=1 Tax=Necator americanus TaxID=51031 RepID=A0ABR1BWS5_NECAM
MSEATQTLQKGTMVLNNTPFCCAELLDVVDPRVLGSFGANKQGRCFWAKMRAIASGDNAKPPSKSSKRCDSGFLRTYAIRTC